MIYLASLASLFEFNPAKIYICLKDLVSSVAWSPNLAVPKTVQSPKCQIKFLPIFPGLQYEMELAKLTISDKMRQSLMR